MAVNLMATKIMNVSSVVWWIKYNTDIKNKEKTTLIKKIN